MKLQTNKTPRTPDTLEANGGKFWKQINQEFELEFHHLKLLQQACHCLDRISQAQDAVKAAGPYHADKNGIPRPHPGLKVELENRSLFLRCIRELCLDIENPETRPPRQY